MMDCTILILSEAMKAFKNANTLLKGKGKDSHILVEHIEAFLYIADKQETLMRDAQKDLSYGQAKTHRVFKHLRRLGWVKIVIYPDDERQRLVSLTKDGNDFFNYLGERHGKKT